jgi:hypothetical protein
VHCYLSIKIRMFSTQKGIELADLFRYLASDLKEYSGNSQSETQIYFALQSRMANSWKTRFVW